MKPRRAQRPSQQLAALPLALLLVWGGIAAAQPNPGDAPAAIAPGELPTFGLEFEVRARGVRITRWEDQRYENFERILRDVVRAIGGDPSKITRVDWTVEGPGGRPRTLTRAEFHDARGGLWKVEPEYVDSRAPDGYELVTPALRQAAEVARIMAALRPHAAEGIKSSVHVHVDGRSLIGAGGDATALINLINLHETYEPLLRRLFDPVRGAGLYDLDPRTGAEGSFLNRFNRPLYRDHADLLVELAALPEGERTRARLESLFRARTEAEARAHGIETLDAKGWKKMWKYRSLNLANALNINDVLPNSSGTVEFRMNDLRLDDPQAHQRQIELYRALVVRARALAVEGTLVPAPNHRAVPAGANPVEFLTAADPARAAEDVREMLREVGLDPAVYEPLIRRTVRAPPVLSESGFRRALEDVSVTRVTFSTEGAPSGVGEAGLRTALERMGRPGERALPLEVRVRVPPVEASVAFATATRLAEGANLARLLARAAHDGVSRPLGRTPTVEVIREPNAIRLKIDPRGVSLRTVEDLARILSDGILTAVRSGRAGVRGGGAPSLRGSLSSRAADYAVEVEGRALPAETREALRRIEAAGGRDLLLPLLEWSEATLPRPTQRDLGFRREVFLREAIAAAESIGQTGEPRAVEAVRTAVRTWAGETGLARLLHRSLLPTGFERAVASAAARPDRFAAYRRADGTLDWKRATKDRALREAGGMAQFALALFLKELAVVARTGDRARIDEFFEGLLTTDFYAQYGLFVLGARAGEVAYTRYLQRFVKPGFVNGILKTNLVLATGLALPQIVGGTFEGKAFAISLTSLGLSTAAVRAGVASLRWVVDLRRARQAGTLARVASVSRLARLGGWFYSAVELAVILFVADDIEHAIGSALDLRAARSALADAGRTFFAAAGDPAATPESVREAAEAYHAAWGDYRNYLYAPLQRDEVLFASRVKKVARKAKLAADEREAALKRIRNHPALLANIERRHGSLERYAETLVAASEAEVARDLETYARSYERARTDHLEEIYDGSRRGGALLGEVTHRDWLLTGARDGSLGDPAGARTDIFASWNRSRTRSSLGSALRSASTNRLQAYDDEAEVLALAAAALRVRGRGDLAAALTDTRDLALRTRDVDDRLAHGDGIAAVGGTARSGGAVGALEPHD